MLQILKDGDDGDVEAVKKMVALYKSCQDTDTIDELGVEPLIQVIQETGQTSSLYHVSLSLFITAGQTC